MLYSGECSIWLYCCLELMVEVRCCELYIFNHRPRKTREIKRLAVASTDNKWSTVPPFPCFYFIITPAHAGTLNMHGENFYAIILALSCRRSINTIRFNSDGNSFFFLFCHGRVNIAMKNNDKKWGNYFRWYLKVVHLGAFLTLLETFVILPKPLLKPDKT